MSNPHDINLGTKILIIEARATEGRDRIGTCSRDNREMLNNGDEKNVKKTIGPLHGPADRPDRPHGHLTLSTFLG